MAKQTYASPLSFVGSTRRLSKWASRGSTGRRIAAWSAVVVALPLVWLLLLGWYFIVFVLFGIVTIPFRLIRRGQRKNQAQLREMRDLMERQTKAG